MVEHCFRKAGVGGSIPPVGSDMRKTYSRLASVEEKRNIRSALLFIVLTVGILTSLAFVGVPLLGKFTVFVSELGKSNKPITSTDTTPPAPPRFNTFPDFTNQKTVTISGNSETGATIKITFNGKEQSSLANKDGIFSVSFDLADGNNTFSAVAVDTAGNISQKTAENSIVFDTKAPDLTIDSPSDGSSFFGSKQQQVTIQGTTETGAQVTINDRIIAVDDNGKFQYTASLNDGGNTFVVKSTDQAGNTTEKDLTLNFSS